MTDVIESKILDLCNAIAADSSISAARNQAETFLADTEAVGLYRDLMTKSREMQHRQHHGEDVDDNELQELVELKAIADKHDGIQAFHAAQDRLQEVVELVNGFVTKTLERGVVPSKDEVVNRGGGCGEGCGCH